MSYEQPLAENDKFNNSTLWLKFLCISAFGWHTFTSYGDLYIEDYDFLGDLFLEVYPSGIYIYSPYAVHKVTGSNSTITASTNTINYTLSNGLVIYETDGTTITSGQTYYFKVEPIKWRVVEEIDGAYTLLSEYIIDKCCDFTTW